MCAEERLLYDGFYAIFIYNKMPLILMTIDPKKYFVIIGDQGILQT